MSASTATTTARDRPTPRTTTSRRAITRDRFVFSQPNRDDLEDVIGLAHTGAVRPIVGRIFDLSDTEEAIRQIETGHGTGRTVVTIGTRTMHGGGPRP